MPPLMALLPAAIAPAAAATGTAAAAGTAAATAMSALPMVSAAGITSSMLAPAATAAAAAGTGMSLGSIFGIGSTILGMGMDAMGKIQQGETQAKILEANAQASRMEAKSIEQQASAQQLKLSQERRKMIGSQVATLTGAGIDPGSGSALSVIEETARNYEEDIQQLGYAGATRTAAKQYEATINEWEAPNRRRAGWWGAAGSVFGGLSKLGMTRYQYA